MAAVVKSEDVLGQKWDRCLVDCGIKMGSGLAVGAVLSLVLFKRRAWPLVFGTGSGFGKHDILTKKLQYFLKSRFSRNGLLELRTRN